MVAIKYINNLTSAYPVPPHCSIYILSNTIFIIMIHFSFYYSISQLTSTVSSSLDLQLDLQGFCNNLCWCSIPYSVCLNLQKLWVETVSTCVQIFIPISSDCSLYLWSYSELISQYWGVELQGYIPLLPSLPMKYSALFHLVSQEIL